MGHATGVRWERYVIITIAMEILVVNNKINITIATTAGTLMYLPYTFTIQVIATHSPK